MTLLYANALAIIAVIAAGLMAYTGHPGFGVAFTVLAFLSGHSVKGRDE